VGGYEIGTPVSVEPSLGYHPCSTEILTRYLESGIGTLSGGQFDWGGRLPKSNGGAQRFSQHGRKSCVECKGRRELDCKTYRSSKDESRT
jgi:hypothetical protein